MLPKYRLPSSLAHRYLSLALLLACLYCASASAAETPDNWVGPADNSYKVLHLAVYYYGCVLMDLPDDKGVKPLPEVATGTPTTQQHWLETLNALPEASADAQAAEYARVQEQLQDCARFYWRNSRFNCLLDFDWHSDFTVMPRSAISDPDAPYFTPSAALYKPAQTSHDGVIQLMALYAYDKETGALKRVTGGGGFTNGVDVKQGLSGISWWAAPPAWHVCGSDWLLCHEFGHELDSLFNACGTPQFWYNHLALSEGNVARFGEHFDCMAYILRRVTESDWAELKFGETRFYNDADGDGAPDADSPGLSGLGLALDPDSASDDGEADGLGDRAELLMGNGNREGHGERLHGALHFCDPTVRDSDGDGLPDGGDEYPTLPLHGIIGHLSMPPGWLEEQPDPKAEASSFTPEPMAAIDLWPDSESRAPDLGVRMGYNENQDLVILLLWSHMDKMPRPVTDPSDCEVRLNFDFDDNGWFSGTDNYRIEANRDGVTKVMRNLADSHTEWPREDTTGVKPEQVGFERLGAQDQYMTVIKLTLKHEVFPELACKPGEEFGCNIGIRYRGDPKYQMIAEPNGFVVLELR